MEKIESPLLSVIEHALKESPAEQTEWNEVSLRLLHLLNPSLDNSRSSTDQNKLKEIVKSSLLFDESILEE